MKNKIAMMENPIEIILWIIFFLLAMFGVYFLIKRVGL